jgi:hypothetical protein
MIIIMMISNCCNYFIFITLLLLLFYYYYFIIIISHFYAGIYNYVSEIHQFFKACIVTTIPCLRFVLFASMCAVLNTAVLVVF